MGKLALATAAAVGTITLGSMLFTARNRDEFLEESGPKIRDAITQVEDAQRPGSILNSSTLITKNYIFTIIPDYKLPDGKGNVAIQIVEKNLGPHSTALLDKQGNLIEGCPNAAYKGLKEAREAFPSRF